MFEQTLEQGKTEGIRPCADNLFLVFDHMLRKHLHQTFKVAPGSGTRKISAGRRNANAQHDRTTEWGATRTRRTRLTSPLTMGICNKRRKEDGINESRLVHNDLVLAKVSESQDYGDVDWW